VDKGKTKRYFANLSKEEHEIAPWFIRNGDKIYKRVLFVVGIVTCLITVWAWIVGGLNLGSILGAVLIWIIGSGLINLAIIHIGFLFDAYHHTPTYFFIFLLGPFPGVFFWGSYAKKYIKPRLSERLMNSDAIKK